ncbi:hypothetical protein NC652_028790 [Populus alba x Populus x berolinensis]|nr:hypothetical protein NC652_028790 [Populus alba x Populus x berolinensis]
MSQQHPKPHVPHPNILKTNQAAHKKPVPGQSSWADRVRISDSTTRFTLEQLPRQPAGQSLKITDDMLLDNSEQWNRCMIGFFPGFRMPFHAVNSIAVRAWRQYGLESVMTTTNGFIIFRFNTADEMQTVLEKGPWMFGGKNIILQQWHPRFQFDKNKISTLPVWIRLHGLPFPLWSRQGLSLAASMVGRPLSCDELTYNCSRLEYARLCVEVDAALPFVHSFEIESPLSIAPITVTVDYEWKPQSRAKCNVFGHSCKSPPPPTAEDKGNHTITDPTSTSNNQDTTPLIPPQPAPTSDQLQPESSPKHTATTTLLHCIQPSSPQHLPLVPQTIPPPQPLPTQPLLKPNTELPGPITLEEYDSSQESGNEHHGIQHHHLNTLHENICFESKMDSLRSTSESSFAIKDALAETSTSVMAPNIDSVQSPIPSPTSTKKKKGGRKKKEARGH